MVYPHSLYIILRVLVIRILLTMFNFRPYLYLTNFKNTALSYFSFNMDIEISSITYYKHMPIDNDHYFFIDYKK